MERLILSTGNRDKVMEMKEILKGLPFTIYSKDELGYQDFDVVEDQETLEGNALKKARALWKETGGVVLADDTGLFVEALDGAPGVYSARYAGETATYDDNCEKMLLEMEKIPFSNRKAVFRTVIALVMEDGEAHLVSGEIQGYISEEKRGEKGFGYDPLFWVSEYEKTFGELTSEEKNFISHRGRALQALKSFLKERYSE